MSSLGFESKGAAVDRLLLVLDGVRLEEVGRGRNRRILKGWWIHPSLNVWMRAHRMSVVRETEQWISEICRRAEGIDGIRGPVMVTVTSYFPTARRRDYGNFTPKFILDGIVRAGLIEDDNSQIIVDERIRFRMDPDNPRTEVLIESISSPRALPLPLDLVPRAE